MNNPVYSLTLLSAVLLFAPRLQFIPISLNYILLLILSILFFCFKRPYIFGNLRIFLLLMLPGFLYCFTQQLLHDPASLMSLHSFSTYYILGIMTLLSSASLHRIYSTNLASNPLLLIRSLCYALFLNISITILTSVFPISKSFIYSIFALSSKSVKFLNPDQAQYLRFSGISTIAFSAYSVLLCYLVILFLITIYRRSSTTSSVAHRLGATFIASISLIVGLLAGRSLFIALAIILISFFICYLARVISTSTLKFTTSINPSVVLLLILITVGIVLLTRSLSTEQATYYLELFLDIDNIKQMPTYQALNSMWFTPDRLDHLIFGDGNFGTDPSHRLQTDIGWVYMIHGSGILGILLMSIPFITLPFLRCNPVVPAFYLISIPISFIVLNFKDLYFFGPGSFTYLFSCLYFSYYYCDRIGVDDV